MAFGWVDRNNGDDKKIGSVEKISLFKHMIISFIMEKKSIGRLNALSPILNQTIKIVSHQNSFQLKTQVI